MSGGSRGHQLWCLQQCLSLWCTGRWPQRPTARPSGCCTPARCGTPAVCGVGGRVGRRTWAGRVQLGVLVNLRAPNWRLQLHVLPGGICCWCEASVPRRGWLSGVCWQARVTRPALDQGRPPVTLIYVPLNRMKHAAVDSMKRGMSARLTCRLGVDRAASRPPSSV